MRLINKFWLSVKRNPVINAFVAAAFVQFSQDYVAGNIDWAHFSGYLATLFLGVMARSFTVPLKDFENLSDNLSRKGEKFE